MEVKRKFSIIKSNVFHSWISCKHALYESMIQPGDLISDCVCYVLDFTESN